LNGNPRKREFFHLACSTDRRAVEYARLFRLARAVIACGLSFFLSLSLSSYSFSFSCCCCWLGFLWAPTMGKKRFWTVCLSIYLSNPPISSLSLSLSLAIFWSELLNYMRCHERTEGRERERPPGRENQKKNIYTEN
jgi:hypothetical protein